MKSYKEILFSTKGTVSRKEYCTYLIPWYLLISAASLYYGADKLKSMAENASGFVSVLIVLFGIFIGLEVFNLSLKRVKDIGLSPNYTLFLLAPFYLNSVFILYLLLKEGKEVLNPEIPVSQP